jgi:hypothetical protein
MTRADWLAESWDMQRCYLEHLANQGLIQFAASEEEQLERMAQDAGGAPHVRKAQAGADVIDLAAMAAELRGA